MQTTFLNSCKSRPVSLHDTTGRLRSGKCYLRSFPHSSFSTSAPNSIAMTTAPLQDLLSSTQPQPVVSNVLTSVSSLPEILVFSSGPSVSTFDQPLASPAICSAVGPADPPNMSSPATSEVPHFRAKLCFHDVSRSASPWRHRRPSHVIFAPVLCADRTVTFCKQWLPCLVHTLCFFCFTAVLFSSSLSFAATYIFGPRPAPPCSHTSFCMFSPATFYRIPAFSPSTISSCIPQTTMCSSVTNSPFNFTFPLCFLFNQAHLGLRPCPSLLSAFQPQSHFHHAFSESTTLHGI